MFRSNWRLTLLHYFKCFFVGLVIGSVYYNLADGSYLGRMGLFACCYLCGTIFTVNAIKGIHRRKNTFLRESEVDAYIGVAYFLSDVPDKILVFLLGAMLFAIPLYLLAGLKDSSDAFLYFYTVFATSMYAHLSLAQLISLLTENAEISTMVYIGIIMPLQIMLGGYLFLISTMPGWLRWGSYIDPMRFFMAGLFRNEFFDNSRALSSSRRSATYNDLADLYDYHSSRGEALFVLLAIGIVYQLARMVLLRFKTVIKKRGVLKKVRSCWYWLWWCQSVIVNPLLNEYQTPYYRCGERGGGLGS